MVVATAVGLVPFVQCGQGAEASIRGGAVYTRQRRPVPKQTHHG